MNNQTIPRNHFDSPHKRYLDFLNTPEGKERKKEHTPETLRRIEFPISNISYKHKCSCKSGISIEVPGEAVRCLGCGQRFPTMVDGVMVDPRKKKKKVDV